MKIKNVKGFCLFIYWHMILLAFVFSSGKNWERTRDNYISLQ